MFHMTFNELKYFVHKIHGICVELGLDSAVVYIPKCFTICSTSNNLNYQYMASVKLSIIYSWITNYNGYISFCLRRYNRSLKICLRESQTVIDNFI